MRQHRQRKRRKICPRPFSASAAVSVGAALASSQARPGRRLGQTRELRPPQGRLAEGGRGREAYNRPFLGRYGDHELPSRAIVVHMPKNTCEHCGGSQLISGLIVSASGGGGDVRPGLLCKEKEKGFFKFPALRNDTDARSVKNALGIYNGFAAHLLGRRLQKR